MIKTNYLALSWSVSRGMDTYGYNICRLDSRESGTRYKCMGGGYDMVGTCIGKWLAAEYQDRLLQIAEQASFKRENGENISNDKGLYGMHYYPEQNKIVLDGACGKESMLRIAEALGIRVTGNWNKRLNRGYGAYEGYFVTDYGNVEALQADENGK